MEARFQVGDLVQRIWNGPGSVFAVQGVIRIPPARWDTEGTEQIAYQIATNFRHTNSQAVVNEAGLTLAVNPLV
jgi:hypothetical protein